MQNVLYKQLQAVRITWDEETVLQSGILSHGVPRSLHDIAGVRGKGFYSGPDGRALRVSLQLI